MEVVVTMEEDEYEEGMEMEMGGHHHGGGHAGYGGEEEMEDDEVEGDEEAWDEEEITQEDAWVIISAYFKEKGLVRQ